MYKGNVASSFPVTRFNIYNHYMFCPKSISLLLLYKVIHFSCQTNSDMHACFVQRNSQENNSTVNKNYGSS